MAKCRFAISKAEVCTLQSAALNTVKRHFAPSWGERTASCLSDAYSGHGWASVWVVIQSGFIPQTAVALAAVCAIKNY